MPLDPTVQRLLDAVPKDLPPYDSMTPPEARAAAAARRIAVTTIEEVALVEDRTISGESAPVRVRIYRPGGTGALPVVVYMHGGGWVFGDLETVDPLCRELANAATCVVVSVGYRLAPEHKFPAPLDDTYAAVAWVASHAAELRVDPTRIAVAGDSAGGNLAACVALMARDRGSPALRFQLLIYPVIERHFDTPSYRDNATGYLLTRDVMRWFWDHYTRTDDDARDPYVAPIFAPSLRALPPALILTAEYDPLRGEGEKYAARLRESGVPVTLSRYDGMVHGFLGLREWVPAGRDAVAECAAALRAAFAPPARVPA